MLFFELLVLQAQIECVFSRSFCSYGYLLCPTNDNNTCELTNDQAIFENHFQNQVVFSTW